MKKSQQPVGENLEAPISLTPEQLEIVAAGLSQITQGGKGSTGGKTTGYAPPILKML